MLRKGPTWSTSVRTDSARAPYHPAHSHNPVPAMHVNKHQEPVLIKQTCFVPRREIAQWPHESNPKYGYDHEHCAMSLPDEHMCTTL